MLELCTDPHEVAAGDVTGKLDRFGALRVNHTVVLDLVNQPD